jgi:tRNA nucleotidyltransferase (CCA-adding enzyme)
MSDYLHGVISKHTADHSAAQLAAQSIYPIVQNWGGNFIVKSSFSGSFAKGTAISLTSDADIFISLSSEVPNTLKEIYDSLYNTFVQRGYAPRRQNVSIGIDVNGYKIDLVPGKRHNQYDNYHSLFRHKLNTWTQTNVGAHISYVKNSNRIKEIKLAKI